MRMARHALKVMFTFCLLDRQQMPRAGIGRHFADVGLYRDFNTLFFQLPPERLAELVVGELERLGAVRDVDGMLVPA